MSSTSGRVAWIAVAMSSLIYAAVLKHYSTQGFRRYMPAPAVEGPAGSAPQIVPYSAWRRWLEPLFQRPFRPSNEAVQYGRPLYTSDAPLVGG